MSKFVGVIAGFGEALAGGLIIMLSGGALAPLGLLLISAGIGTMVAGTGTLIASLISGGGSQSQQQGVSVATRNPTASRSVVYGRAVIGGTIIFINEFGDNNKWLDMVIVLAAHPCEAFDRLLFDKQYVQLQDNGDGTYDSFSPLQQTVNITHIVRAAGVVTATLDADIPLLQPGDRILVQTISGAPSLEGRWPVSEVVHGSGTCTVVYISGGTDTTVDHEGTVTTQWADYGRKIHLEVMLGTQTLGTTFPGMLSGTPNDGDSSDLILNTPNPWNANCSLVGQTAVFLRLHYDATVFSAGMPAISFLIRGKNDIYDPRLGAYGDPGTTAYTENAALCTYDYIAQSEWGFRGLYGSEIPLDVVTAEANICDEAVPLAAGGTEPRYTVNGTFDLSRGRGEILQNLLTASAGRLVYQQGQFILQTAAWRGSSPAPAPSMGAMAGGFRWSPKCNPRELFNGIKGTFICPANNWHPSDIPPYAQDVLHGYSSDSNLITDGGDRRWEEVQLPFTISAATAQRLCKIELLRRRQMGTGTFRFNLSAYQFTALDVISMDLSVFGWSGKLLEITAHRFVVDKQQAGEGDAEVPILAIELDVQETDASIYDWSTTEELTPEGYQQPSLPNPYTPAPPTDLVVTSNLETAISTPAGLADSILAQWTAPTDGYVLSGGHMEVQFQKQATYLTGTISATNGNANITGTGTAWTAEMDGGTISIGGTDYVIKAVSTATALILASAFAGTTASSLSYGISYTGPWTGLPSVNPSVTQVHLNGVEDGALYNVQVRSVNAGGFPSQWISGSVKAEGAALPMPWRPYGETYLFARTLSSFRFLTGSGTVSAYGARPVNVFSATCGQPSIDAFARVSAHVGNTLPIMSGVVQVFGIDADGAPSPGSNLAQFQIHTAASRLSFGVTWGALTVDYRIFAGPDKDSLVLVGHAPVGGGGLPATIDIDILPGYSNGSLGFGYGPPDGEAVAALIRGKAVTSGGIGVTGVAASDAGSVTIGVPSAFGLDDLVGRYLIRLNNGLSSAAAGNSIVGPITGNDAGSPLCALSIPNGVIGGHLALVPGDLVMISTLSDTNTGTSIGDSRFVSPFGPSGFVADQLKNLIARIWYDPAGTAWGATATVVSNTATVATTTQFRLPDGTAVSPGAGSIFAFEEVTWGPQNVTTVAANPIEASPVGPSDDVLATLQTVGLEGKVAMVQILLRNASGDLSMETTDALRMIYIPPVSSTAVTAPYVVPDAAGIATPDASKGDNLLILTAANTVADANGNPSITLAAPAGYDTTPGNFTKWTLIVQQDPATPSGGYSTIFGASYKMGFAVSTKDSAADTQSHVDFKTDSSGISTPTGCLIDQPIS